MFAITVVIMLIIWFDIKTLHVLETYMNDVVPRIAKNANDALNSFVDGEPLRMMLMGVKRYAKYKHVNVKEARRAIAQPIIESNSYCY